MALTLFTGVTQINSQRVLCFMDSDSGKESVEWLCYGDILEDRIMAYTLIYKVYFGIKRSLLFK